MLDAIDEPGVKDAMIAAGREALAVGMARGHRPLPIFGLTEADLGAADSLVETMLGVLYARFVVAGATTTVLQDWRKGRRSEVDDVNGLVVSEGRRLGIPTPANGAIVELGHRIERGELSPAPEHGRLLASFPGQ
jgi:2-dehydropantoate 2-reductase